MMRIGRMTGLATILGSALLATSVSASLPIGTRAPDFETRGALAGKVFNVKLSDMLRKGPVVLYFFPAAFTKGCTAETKEFADTMDQFKAAGATVVGMSADSVDVLQRFSTEACGGKFAVASAGPRLVASYDVALKSDNPAFAGKTDRTSYVISPTGRIVFVHSALDYRDHVRSTLAAVQSLAHANH